MSVGERRFPMNGEVVVAAVIGYYLVGKELGARTLGRLVARVTARWSTVPPVVWDDVVRLGVVTVLQIGFMGLLLRCTQVQLGGWFNWSEVAANAATGVALGVGEYSTGALLCQAAMRSWDMGPEPGGDRDEAVWGALMHAGWMGRYFRARREFPISVVVCLAATYVVCEEVVFRGILLSVLEEVGFLPAYLASVGCFVASQFGGMPGVRAALFPAIGATVIGCVHAGLFWTGTDLFTLIVAHVVCIAVPLAVHD